MKKSAFTLIELLVVITIIAVLAGIALPVFSGVQERARAMQDANNLKQIGIATTAYFNDHDDTIFVTGSAFAPLLNPQYISVWKTFQSPFDKRTASEVAATAPVSYDLNKNLVGKSCGDVVSSSSCIMVAPLVISAYPNLTFTGLGASNTPPNLDMIAAHDSTTTWGTHGKGKRINALFHDAHVESMTLGDFNGVLSGTSGTVTNLRWNK